MTGVQILPAPPFLCFVNLVVFCCFFVFFVTCSNVVGFQFKPRLAAVLAVLNGVSVGLAYIVSQGNITATIIWFARNNRRHSSTMLQ